MGPAGEQREGGREGREREGGEGRGGEGGEGRREGGGLLLGVPGTLEATWV